MAQKVDIRIGHEGRKYIEEYASENDTTLLDAGRELVSIGAEKKKRGEPKIDGPFGVSRPFSKIELPGRKTTMKIRVRDKEMEEASRLFDSRKKSAYIREALRLGILSNDPEEVKITGPGGVTRPFAGGSI